MKVLFIVYLLLMTYGIDDISPPLYDTLFATRTGDILLPLYATLPPPLYPTDNSLYPTDDTLFETGTDDVLQSLYDILLPKGIMQLKNALFVDLKIFKYVMQMNQFIVMAAVYNF